MEQRKNIILPPALAAELTSLRQRIKSEAGLTVSEQDLIRSGIAIYVETVASLDLSKLTTASALDRLVLERLSHA